MENAFMEWLSHMTASVEPVRLATPEQEWEER